MPLTDVVWSLFLVTAVTAALVLLLPPLARSVTKWTEKAHRANLSNELNRPESWRRLIPEQEWREFRRRQVKSCGGTAIAVAVLFGAIYAASGTPPDLFGNPVFVLGYPLVLMTWASLCLVRARSKRGELLLDLRPANELREPRSSFIFWFMLAVTILVGFSYYETRHSAGMVLIMSMLFLYQATLSSFVSQPVGIHSNGIFSRLILLPWNQVTWYRWYEKQDAVLFGAGGRAIFDQPFIIVPLPHDRATEAEALLQEYLPSKRLPNVEDVLGELKVSGAK